MDRNVLDYEKVLLQGEAQYSDHKFDARNITLEQTFFDKKAGIEIAYDKQSYYNERFFPWGRHTYAGVKIDTGKWLTNGLPNPNLGRPFMTGQYDPVAKTWNDRVTKRVTAFYDLDLTEKEGFLKYLGRHTVTALYSEWENDTWNFSDGLSWDTSHDKTMTKNIGQLAGSWGGRIFGWAYVGDGQWNANSPSEVRL
ncbi:MAG: hypothetical protein D6781_05860 [Verrucomicrobia bacterium]|nr:MAG: hypothetical protein D6781_05860 [Verrucomicrobiota bacterium]